MLGFAWPRGETSRHSQAERRRQNVQQSQDAVVRCCSRVRAGVRMPKLRTSTDTGSLTTFGTNRRGMITRGFGHGLPGSS